MPERHHVASTDEVPIGARKIVHINGKSIGVFNVNGRYVAILNLCPHAFAPICAGKVGGTTLKSAPGDFKWGRDNEIIKCPWHGWEFDLLSGSCLTDKRRLHHYEVDVIQQEIYILV